MQGAADLGPSRPGGWGLTHVRGSLRWGLNVRPQVGPTRGNMATQCSPFTGIGPEAKSKPVTLRIKYGIYPIKSGIYPNPAAESKLG